MPQHVNELGGDKPVVLALVGPAHERSRQHHDPDLGVPVQGYRAAIAEQLGP
jgi:hypothetical protein